MSVFVQQQHTVCSFTTSDSWVILSPIEQSIKQKIEAVGTPLKDWNIQINYGIKTGYNDAFIIDTDKRNEILSQTADYVMGQSLKDYDPNGEYARTAELIRPILRGRDIKRYGYNWAGLYLIATFPSRHYDIEKYPAVKNYLLEFGVERLEQTGKSYIINGETIKARKKTNNKWFETQDSISYWDLFFQPHICWKAVGRNLAFALVESGTFLTAPASFISAGIYNKTVLAFLCSTVGTYFIYKNSDTTGAGDIMLNIQSLVKFPIPQLDVDFDSVSDSEINQYIYDIYKFTREEILYIEEQV